MSEHHYETLAKWLKEIGLLTAGSLVLQKVVLGVPFADPTVILGVAVSVTMYLFALYLLLRS